MHPRWAATLAELHCQDCLRGPLAASGGWVLSVGEMAGWVEERMGL